ncbi:MAG: inorganic diphosphatase [Planctomycetota bacterium]
MNPWHDISLGRDPARVFRCLIEIPRGSSNKYELDKETGLLKLDRVLYSAVHYPANYGFLPQTYCEDGDPLDVLVLCQEAITPMCLVLARPIGVLQMIDDNGRDDKIIAVPKEDPEYAGIHDVGHLPPHRLQQLRQFMLDYKTLEDKEVHVEPIEGAAVAQKVILEAIELYRKEFGS